MTASLFDLFRIGVGPSSSHTMGPMTAAKRFIDGAAADGPLQRAARVRVDLYGSLALTGKGHGSDRALLLGLSGYEPATICPDAAEDIVADIRAAGAITLGGQISVRFDEAADLVFRQKERLPFHSNALRFTLCDRRGDLLRARIYYSVGGGTVLDEAEAATNASGPTEPDLPFSFSSGEELLAITAAARRSIAQAMMANEEALRPRAEVRDSIKSIVAAMQTCIDRGMDGEGALPGGLGIERRARRIHRTLLSRGDGRSDALEAMDWVSLWALAVNEENAAGSRIVTAPTNGAAGIIPAVLRYYLRFVPRAREEGAIIFLLTAAAIGSLFKENASISGAEVGCQGEVGVACSMAAAGLAAVLGGSNTQVENAAEIAMEHHLGLTCDPIAGLVQVPCIERNAMGAIKAIEAARLALLGDGTHRVSLDQVIDTMRRTGADMHERYKETSLGGLALALC